MTACMSFSVSSAVSATAPPWAPQDPGVPDVLVDVLMVEIAPGVTVIVRSFQSPAEVASTAMST